MQPHEFQTQMNRLSASLMKPSITEKNMDILFAEVQGMNADIFKASVEIMMKETERNFMPKLTELYKYYNIAKKEIRGEEARNNGDDRKIPDHILNRTDEEVAKEFDRWISFYEAYPYPDYPEGATTAQCEAIDRNYQGIMKKNGFDPDEFDPKANLLFINYLKKQAPENAMSLPYNPEERISNVQENF